MIQEKIENICVVVRGSSPRPQGDPRYYGGQVPRLMVSDVTRDGMYVTPKIDFLTEAGAKLGRPMLKGDLVVAVSGDPGEPSILNVDACIHDGFVGLRNLNAKLVYTPYLYRYFKFNKLRSKSQVVGAIYKNLNTDQIKNLVVPLPPLTEQKKIAALLDAADSLRQKDKALVAKYDELTQSLFLEMFGDPVRNEKGWEKLNGNEYAEKISVGVVIQPASYYVEKGVIALRSLNIRPNKIVLENLVYFSEQANKNQLHKSILKENDVVIVRTGATGTAAVVPKILDGCNCIDLIIVRADKSIINPIYLSLFFNSDFGKNIVSGKEVGGIQKHFNIGAIKSLSIPVPPIGIQNRFAVIVKNILQQKEVLNLQIEQSENLFQGLLQRSFKGELVK